MVPMVSYTKMTRDISTIATPQDIHTFILSLCFVRYKTPDDKPLNGFGFDEKFLDAAEAKKVIEETHVSWKNLREGKTDAGKLWIGQ
jgi:hypothetical protein